MAKKCTSCGEGAPATSSAQQISGWKFRKLNEGLINQCLGREAAAWLASSLALAPVPKSESDVPHRDPQHRNRGEVAALKS
jgi:hypothetical protein